MHPDCYWVLGFHFDGNYYDKCYTWAVQYPISISKFLPSSLDWTVKFEAGSSFVHYLDDFLFIGPKVTDTCCHLLRVCGLQRKVEC